jgi:hypothetical protein
LIDSIFAPPRRGSIAFRMFASTEFCAPTHDVIKPVASRTASFVLPMKCIP